VYNVITEVKELLAEEPRTFGDNDVSFLPITHNDDEIFLQFVGWSINLYADGTWIWTATDGG